MNDLVQMIKQNDLLKIGLILLGVYLLMTYTNTDKKSTEKMTNEDIYEHLDNVDSKVVNGVLSSSPQVPAPAPVDTQQSHIDSIVAGKDALKTEDLLPKYDEANEFAKQNPVSNLLKEQNFLVSGYSMGINTVMQSNKIPVNDLRSTPPIAKDNTISPWGMSSYETPSGSGRRMMEIGSF